MSRNKTKLIIKESSNIKKSFEDIIVQYLLRKLEKVNSR